MFSAYAEQFNFSGTVLVARGDTIIIDEGFGFADPEFGIKNIPQTKCMIGSLTKQFTAAALLLLAEEGKLSLDDRLNLYLPDFPNGGAITLGELLSQTSGLPREGNYIYWIDQIEPSFFENELLPQITDEALKEKVKNSYVKKEKSYYFNEKTGLPVYDLAYLFTTLGYHPAAEPHSVTDGVNQLIHSQNSRNKKSNNQFVYSNYGYMLLGLVIEKASGMSYESYLQKNIFDKLEMGSSGCGYDQNSTSMLAQGYYTEFGADVKMPYQVNTYVWPGSAGMTYSTTRDLLLWLNGMRYLLKESSVNELFTPHALTHIPNTSYGYGFFITHRIIKGKEKKIYWHDGRIYNYHSLISIIPEDDIKVIILSSQGDTSSIYYWPYIIAEILFKDKELWKN